jgi:hypothetical protein
MGHQSHKHHLEDEAVHRLRRWKSALAVLAVSIPFVVVLFVVADHLGVLDSLTGLAEVEAVSERFNRSYSEDASTPVRSNDKAWQPLLALVQRYSSASLPSDRQPRVIARLTAPQAIRNPPTGPIESEWTPSTTPLLLLYKDWPGNSVDPQDYRIIGSIGDLQEWIMREKDRRRVLAIDIFFGICAGVVGLLIFLLDRRLERRP